jgi:hypothetical protein
MKGDERDSRLAKFKRKKQAKNKLNRGLKQIRRSQLNCRIKQDLNSQSILINGK